jgi:ADP-ribosylglycohydrolase
MLGAIAGDIIGSVFESSPVKTKDFDLFSRGSIFTDDTVLTIAVAKVLLTQSSYEQTYRDFYRQYPNQGYGYGFSCWATSAEDTPYYSYGNGSAMRVNPVGWVCNDMEEILAEARRSAVVTHNHEEGIKGAQAVAAAIYMARNGYDKIAIKDFIAATFNYELDRKLDDIRPVYSFDVSCQGSVPESIIAFLESTSYEDAVRNAVSLGGDSDTMACIAGAIAEAYYKYIDTDIILDVFARLPHDLAAITQQFTAKYCHYQYTKK